MDYIDYETFILSELENHDLIIELTSMVLGSELATDL